MLNCLKTHSHYERLSRSYDQHDRIGNVNRNQNRNQSFACWNLNRSPMMLELESKLESRFWETLESESEAESLATGIGIGIGIMDFGKPWNQNQSRNQP